QVHQIKVQTATPRETETFYARAGCRFFASRFCRLRLFLRLSGSLVVIIYGPCRGKRLPAALGS
ncbi:MAG: hypothetical protein QXL28_03160, partial [Desulfurococcaceae archaeon]